MSSATVRNDMATLEAEGYLQQPHTSAGRIPTEKGYRWFVDALVEPSLDRAASQQVRAFFNQAHGEIEQMLHDTTRLLSGLTDYAAVVVGPAHEGGTVRSVQIVGLAPRVALFVAVLSNGVVEKRTLELRRGSRRGPAGVRGRGASEPAPRRLDVGRLRLRCRRRGQPMSTAWWPWRSPRSAGAEDAETDVFVGGASRMAEAFDAVESVRSVLAILEQQLVVVSLLRDVLDRGLTVAIGTETGHPPARRVLDRGGALRHRGRTGRHDRRARADSDELLRRRWPRWPWCRIGSAGD